MDTITNTARQVLFPRGRTLATPGALALLEESYGDQAREAGRALLERHVTGDWGDLGAGDLAANDAALRDGERIFSAYNLPKGERLWIITEWDRSSTTILMPEEH